MQSRTEVGSKSKSLSLLLKEEEGVVQQEQNVNSSTEAQHLI